MFLQEVVENLRETLLIGNCSVRTCIYCASGPTGAKGSCTTPDDPKDPRESRIPSISPIEGRRDYRGENSAGAGVGAGASVIGSTLNTPY